MRAVLGLLRRGLAVGVRSALGGPERGLAEAAAEDRRVAGPGAGGNDVQVLGVGTHSRWVDLDGPVHYLDFGGPASGPMLVCIHGLAGSAVNWSAIAPALTGTCRMLAVDLPGHGLTQSQRRGTGMPAMHALLHRFIETVRTGPVILVGNSMGGMISLLEASAAPAAVAGVVLIDPVLPLVPAVPDHYVTPMLAAYAVPVLGPLLMRRRRRQSPEDLVGSILSLCCVDTSRVPAGVLTQHVTIARQALSLPETEQQISASARSMIAIFAGDLLGGAYRRAISSITCPVLLLHGTRDRLVPITVARAAAHVNPAWTMIEVPGVGHVPQLEAPDDTASAIIGWLGSAGQPAAQAATPAPGPPAPAAAEPA
ncbi:MAG TPA: alpha/beta hydrolase [Streptosporangiaceae bacterium]|nr:alpha/beta hydrolase [Streptosporangiaceae bacterium]